MAFFRSLRYGTERAVCRSGRITDGEIAEDLTYYFAASEQVPSAVGLGVLMNKDNTVRQAGGFIVQVIAVCRRRYDCKT